MQKPEKITKITDDIYLGGYWYNHYNQNRLLKMLKELGVTDIINCAEEIPFYISLRDGSSVNYIKYAWYDTPDFNLFPSIEAAESYLNKLVSGNNTTKQLYNSTNNNNNSSNSNNNITNIKNINKYRHVVYVHCAMGISRSASLVIFHLMKRLNWSYEQAYTYVKQRRQSVEPNHGFAKQLQNYEKQS